MTLRYASFIPGMPNSDIDYARAVCGPLPLVVALMPHHGALMLECGWRVDLEVSYKADFKFDTWQ